jgi:hypothetical protein
VRQGHVRVHVEQTEEFGCGVQKRLLMQETYSRLYYFGFHGTGQDGWYSDRFDFHVLALPRLCQVLFKDANSTLILGDCISKTLDFTTTMTGLNANAACRKDPTRLSTSQRHSCACRAMSSASSVVEVVAKTKIDPLAVIQIRLLDFHRSANIPVRLGGAVPQMEMLCREVSY